MRRNGAGSAAHFFRDFAAGWYTSGIAIPTGDGEEDATARLVALYPARPLGVIVLILVEDPSHVYVVFSPERTSVTLDSLVRES